MVVFISVGLPDFLAEKNGSGSAVRARERGMRTDMRGVGVYCRAAVGDAWLRTCCFLGLGRQNVWKLYGDCSIGCIHETARAAGLMDYVCSVPGL